MTDDRVNELDGMRGLGMALVVSYHILKRAVYFTANPILHFFTAVALYGWYALTTFYVLSGFLIGTILLRTKDKEHYFKNFYVRRALRVLPLYYFTVVVMVLLTIYTQPQYVSRLVPALPYYLFYLNNIFHLVDGVKDIPYLGVTWSLAIEEQFYLIFPLVVYYAKKETLVKICGALIGVSILTRILGAFFWHDVIQMTNFFFYNTFTRFEEISFGILVAVAFTYPEWKNRLSKIALPVFLVMFTATILVGHFSETGVPHPLYGNVLLTVVGYTMASIFAAALVVSLTTLSESSVIRWIFRNKILIFWGKHSYAIYLYHMPVGLLLLDLFWQSGYRGWYVYVSYVGLTFGITILIALLVWYLVEKPALDLKRYFEYS